MSILEALTEAWLARSGPETPEDRRLPPFGYTLEKTGWLLSLNRDGSLAGEPVALGKDYRLAVPQPPKRASGIAPGFLCDNASYVLGVGSGDECRLARVHEAFVSLHREALAGSDDPGLQALLAFLDQWTAEDFVRLGWPEEMKGQNIVFCLEEERLKGIYLHDRPAARLLWGQQRANSEGRQGLCLVSGRTAALARLHPSIKGVWGAQTSGASIVSFNQESFTSWGFEQGDNAPVSSLAAFAYTSVLNSFLATGSANRMQLADTSLAFWARVRNDGNAEAAGQAEELFRLMFDPPAASAGKSAPPAAASGEDDDDGGVPSRRKGKKKPVAVAAAPDIRIQETKVGHILGQIRKLKTLESLDPELAAGVTFYVLGLAPNAARLSVRLWMESSFGQLAENYLEFIKDTEIEPPDHQHQWPALWMYLVEIAVAGKRENIPPTLSGAWLEAILKGGRYPQTLLSLALLRIQADRQVTARRVAILRAVLRRNYKSMEAPVALEESCHEKGYLLGRLFAVCEHVQSRALGSGVNATVRDKFYASASIRPGGVFPSLLRNVQNHIAKIRKENKATAGALDRELATIIDCLSPGETPFPAVLGTPQQALFALGYYHQRQDIIARAVAAKAARENGGSANDSRDNVAEQVPEE